MPDEHDCPCGRTVLLMVVLVGLVVGILSWGATTYCWRADAVRRGYAHIVVQDEYGKTKWEWIKK